MSLSSLSLHLAKAVWCLLCFLASPTGGREIGRDILRSIGLRGRK